jgi:hypothetical protein
MNHGNDFYYPERAGAQNPAFAEPPAMDRPSGHLEKLGNGVAHAVGRVEALTKRVAVLSDRLLGPQAIANEKHPSGKLRGPGSAVNSLDDRVIELQDAISELENQLQRLDTL